MRSPNGLLPEVREIYAGWIDGYNRFLASGRTLEGLPLIGIGFNRNIAWTHTSRPTIGVAGDPDLQHPRAPVTLQAP